MTGQYDTDASGIFTADNPDVRRPKSRDGLVEVMQSAHAQGIPMTFAGGMTGLAGAAVATEGGLVIAMEELLHVEEKCDFEMHTVRTNTGREVTCAMKEDETIFPSGITLEEMDWLLRSHGRWYPPNPTKQTAQLGGSVATNASGSRTFSFGPTRDYVTRLGIVLADGETLSIQRGDTYADGLQLALADRTLTLPSYTMPETKNAAGLYAARGMDAIDLFIGSEGILGAFYEIGVKTVPRREIDTTLLFFGEDEAALAFADRLRDLRLNPELYLNNPHEQELGLLSLEYFDAGSLALADKATPPDAEAAIMVETFKNDSTLENVAELDKGVLESWVDERIIALRRSVPTAIAGIVHDTRIQKVGTDFAVPATRYREMHTLSTGMSDMFVQHTGAKTAMFGHIGDYNLHLNFLPRTPAELRLAQEFYAGLAQAAASMRGTISAEHGVGKKTLHLDGKVVPYLQLMYGTKGTAEIGDVKRQLDPEGLLNIGNMVPRE